MLRPFTLSIRNGNGHRLQPGDWRVIFMIGSRTFLNRRRLPTPPTLPAHLAHPAQYPVPLPSLELLRPLLLLFSASLLPLLRPTFAVEPPPYYLALVL